MMFIVINSQNRKNKFHLKLSHAEWQLCYSVTVTGTSSSEDPSTQKHCLSAVTGKWQQQTLTLTSLITAWGSVWLAIACSLLSFLHFFISFQSVCCQGTKYAHMPKNRPCCTAAVFDIHKPPCSIIHNLPTTRNRIGVRVAVMAEEEIS